MSEVLTITQEVEGLLFGDLWFVGLLIFLILAVAILRMWKWGGVIVIPMLMVLEVKYYENNTPTGDLVWAMVMCGFMILSIMVYTVAQAENNKGD